MKLRKYSCNKKSNQLYWSAQTRSNLFYMCMFALFALITESCKQFHVRSSSTVDSRVDGTHCRCSISNTTFLHGHGTKESGMDPSKPQRMWNRCLSTADFDSFRATLSLHMHWNVAILLSENITDSFSGTAIQNCAVLYRPIRRP